MTPAERDLTLIERQKAARPWHSPPHWNLQGKRCYLLSAACYQHVPIIGIHSTRLQECVDALLAICEAYAQTLHAWVVLPNHYHALLTTDDIGRLRRALGQFHGRSSHQWNGEDNQRGRKVWHNCVERVMASKRHFYVCLNYVHHNAVHHGLVTRWQDWPFSSAHDFLHDAGREEAKQLWRAYPLRDFGKGWD